jgi:mono/diheme cytochrome c family protein
MMRRTSCVVVSVWCVWLSACEGRATPQREWRPDDHGQPQQVDPSRDAPVEPEQGGVERAADALYAVSCASCHGRDGRGQGEARPPGAQLPDFTSKAFQQQRTDSELKQVIRDGRGMMPAFGKQMNEQGQAALVARIRRFAVPVE